MCGLIAVKNSNSPVNTTQLNNGLNAIAHRGPDNQSIWLSENRQTGLGHARLSIIDLASGDQPIVNQTHGISVIVNGEFYGYKSIRKQLEGKGHHFNTHSDSEILIFLYLEYGLDLFEHLRGEFAFVLYDERRDLLLAARDRFGIKPICFYHDAHQLLIASKAKALFELGVPAAWDEYSLMHAASMQYQPTDRTLFKNIHQLSPGHFLRYQDHQLVIKSYWNMNYPDETDRLPQKNDVDAIEEFQLILKESIQLRLVSDVPVCFHLSGGLDSSSIVGLSSQYLNVKKHCFTVTFDGHENYDEAKQAEETAKFTRSVLHKVNLQPDDILTVLEDAVYFSEGLAINGHLSAKFMLNQAIRAAGFKVALTGEGADEVLAGYDHIREDLLSQLPAAERELQRQQLHGANTVSAGSHFAHGAGLDLSTVENKLGFIPTFLSGKASMGAKIYSVLSDEILSQYQTHDFYSDMLDKSNVHQQLQGKHPAHQSLYLWSKLALPNYILSTLGDGCEMASGVEGRLPFLDHKLFEVLRQMPLHLKIRNGLEKFVLREAAMPFITQKVYSRQKHPFAAPPVTAVNSLCNKDFIRDTLQSQQFKNLQLYDPLKCKQLIDKIDKMDQIEQIAYEPVIMFLLTSTLLSKRYKL